MTIKLNHTIVDARDPRASAEFLATLFDLPAPVPFGPFLAVTLANDVTLDYRRAERDDVRPEHYAFLVDEAEFDRIFARIRDRSLKYWADPARHEEGHINHRYGGRGVYFEDPSGHLLEILTQPYGASAE